MRAEVGYMGMWEEEVEADSGEELLKEACLMAS